MIFTIDTESSIYKHTLKNLFITIDKLLKQNCRNIWKNSIQSKRMLLGISYYETLQYWNTATKNMNKK